MKNELRCKWCECREPHDDQRVGDGPKEYCRNGYHDCCDYEPDTSPRGRAMAVIDSVFDETLAPVSFARQVETIASTER